MIRQATYNDADELLRMGEAFYHASGYSEAGAFNRETLLNMLGQLINLNSLLIGEGGAIGWMVYPNFLTGTNFSQELFWWVDEDKRGTRLGIELLKTAEKMAKESGAEFMSMICIDRLDGDKVGRLYEKMGYELKEHTYMRAL